MISEWNPLSIYVKSSWYYYRETAFVQEWANLPSRGGEPFNQKASNDAKKLYYKVEPLGVRSSFGKKQVMVVYMQYAKGTLQVIQVYSD